MAGPDWDDAVKNDVKKLKRAKQGANGKPSPPKIFESIFWGLAVTALIFMVGSMPWVGADKLIPGTAWLTISLLGIGVFGSLAILTRLTFGTFGRRMDSRMTDRFDNR